MVCTSNAPDVVDYLLLTLTSQGPIVRITPNEIHFEDPDFNDVLFPSLGRRKVDRPGYAAARAGSSDMRYRLVLAPGSIVATAEHDVHRRRRNALNSFFSGASVRRLEPILQEHMDKILNRMQKSGLRSEVVELHHMFKACASDIITRYAFGDTFGFMDQPDYGQSYFRAGEAFNSMTHVFGAFPWLLTIATSVPGWLFKYLNPDMTEFVDRREWWIEKVREIRDSKDPERAKNTIFGGILDSSLPAEEKTDQRLANEAQLVVFAGEGTTGEKSIAIQLNVNKVLTLVLEAHTLTSAIFHLLIKPEILQKVKDELKAVVTDKRPIPTFQQLDKLHYTNAVINEAIRLHPGAMHRQARGVEITLARRELAATLATIFVKYDLYRGQPGPTLELYETIRARDIDADRDYITPLPTKGSMGLRVEN
ncbi:cytochrome P450 [Seiridium cupressi]